MPLARRRVALALAVAALMAGAALEIPSAAAQDPPAAGKGQGKEKGNAKAGKKKAPRRKAQVDPVGVIQPYPLGGALIIRHTPEAHDEIRALLDLLRYQP